MQVNAEELEKNGLVMVDIAQSMCITTIMEHQEAGAVLNRITQSVKNIEEQFEEPVRAAHEAHKKIVAMRERVLSPFREAKKLLSARIGDYILREEAKRREAATRAAEDARKRAENERLDQAQAAEARGDKEATESLLNAPIVPRIDPTAIPDAPAKIKGNTVRKEWDFLISDEAAIPREYLVPDEQRIRKVVKALGEKAAIPGVSVFEKLVVGSRGV